MHAQSLRKPRVIFLSLLAGGTLLVGGSMATDKDTMQQGDGKTTRKLWSQFRSMFIVPRDQTPHSQTDLSVWGSGGFGISMFLGSRQFDLARSPPAGRRRMPPWLLGTGRHPRKNKTHFSEQDVASGKTSFTSRNRTSPQEKHDSEKI